MINDQWCDAKVARVIPPTQEEMDKDNEDDDDEVRRPGKGEVKNRTGTAKHAEVFLTQRVP